MSNRAKLVIGAIMLVVVTAIVSLASFLYIFEFGSSDVAKLFRVIYTVKARYVEEVPSDKLLTGAIKGVVASLGDPHSYYMDPKAYHEFRVETEGSFGGVGIVLGMKDNVLTVISPIEGTPGDKAGIKSGDLILKIDGIDAATLKLDEAVSKIRGPEGTQVTLSISRNKEVKDYTLTRTNIQIKTVTGKMLPDQIGYIRLSMFNEATGADFVKQQQELEKQGMKGLVLDLRDNPGGLLSESVKVAGRLVPRGPIVSVVQREGKPEVHYSTLDHTKYPVVVLVNGGSASASEIVSGAIQDTGAGLLVGTKTYGKGSVQSLSELGDGSAIKLTIAKYYTPNGRSIHGVGIEPDVKVEAPEAPSAAGKDVQLDKAVEVLKGKMK